MATVHEHAVVWTEIPVTDMDRARSFYEAVLDCEMVPNDEGPNPMLMFPTSDEKGGIAGHLYPGKPSPGAGPTVHFQVPDTVEAALDRAEANGGQAHRFVVEIPFGRFAYANDPDGNSIGLFSFNAD